MSLQVASSGELLATGQQQAHRLSSHSKCTDQIDIAVNTMERKYRPLRPIPDSSDSGPGSSSGLAVNSSLANKRKRVGVAVACEVCRKRKIRRSVECIYEPKIPRRESGSSESNTGRASRSNTGSNSTGSSGDGLIEAVQLLNKIPPQETITVLRSLKDITDASSILAHLRGRVTELERHPQAVTTELDSLSRTVDLENRYPSAYPILDPLDVCMQSSLFQRLAESGSYKFPSDFLPAKSRSSATPIRQYDTLRRLRIRKWTNVPVPNDLACRIISFYLETEHPALCPFDPELFIDDLITEGPLCTNLLVNALMYWACQMYITIDSEVREFVDAFRTEAERLWHIDKMAPSVLTMASAQFLGFGYLVQGRDRFFLVYFSEATRIGTQLGLFGKTSEVNQSPANNLAPREARATAYSAWGTFNWIMLLGLFYHQPGMEYPATPPSLPIPRKSRGSDNAHLLDATIPDLSEYCDEAFVLFCELWRKMHEVAIVYYNGEAGAVSGRVPVKFAEDTFQGLMEMMNRLPLALTRNEDNPHHVVIFHLWLHAAILDIFRPFLEAVPDAHRSNHPRHSRTNADAIYAASVEQLKRLIIIYRSQYVSSGHTIIWHTAMFLWTSYPIVKPIARGLLSMAMRRGGISSDKARQILVDLGNDCPSPLPHGEVRATFMLDLDLAMSDPNAAKAEAQAEAFEDTAMVVDYTNAFSSQEAVG
ncbi:C6 transcription factor [Beauveria bassiana ARSEF 2860]|uniref:C6 transcription factor n=1 Tax=Beauveria bassiana (strain ARSEF 2860) TaxID=655819 RepID=J5J493_BEAB2|nr:C6 transcription factor [Beauveria bassiana ARSEF 2860]EJP61518.1 C6 transcription factor [Beauveria bassiana ARSEF 2860]